MLIGEYSVAIGDKNRIALPKKLRSQLTDDLIITRGYDGCALILDRKRWQNLISEIGTGALFRMNARDTRRYLLGGASQIELDKQGRFVIPAYILEHTDSASEVVILGVGDWVELWGAERWAEKADYLSKNASDIAERL